MLAIERSAETILITCDGRPLCQYRYDRRASKPHFDVVALPPGARRAGDNIVLARPHDHAWHLGLFFAQKYVDDLDYWGGELYASQGKPHGRNEARGDVVTRVYDDGSVGFAHSVAWPNTRGEDWMREAREIRVRPPAGGGYLIEWAQRLTPLGKDRVLHSASDSGDYAGLSYRCPRSMDKGVLLDSEGRQEVKAILGQPARWADYSGMLDDCADLTDPDWAGLAIFDHPSNPDYPVRWFCMKDPFGFLAANRTYGRRWTLPAGREVVIRYGVYVHAGRLDKSALDARYGEFAGAT